MPFHPARLPIDAAYHPGHWPKGQWAEDIRLMRESGFTVVRPAEFAWAGDVPQTVSLTPLAGM